MIKLKTLLIESLFNLPSFQKWFGKSKVVDNHNRPLILYHGTGLQSNIDVFDTSKKTNAACFYGIGAYFTHDSTKSDFYSRRYVDGKRKGYGGVYAVFLRIEKPAYPDLLKQLSGQYKLYNQFTDSTEAERVTDILKKKGYDGVIVDDEYVVFESNQVKSAIGNNGEFSTTNPDITK